jgi:RNA polymerase sigma-70 factor (ECF subfamily)
MSVAHRHRSRTAPRPDDVLLRAIAEGDLDSLGELYDRHAASMWRAVERLLDDPSDAEDIVHSAFMKLPQIARSYDGRSEARAWLIGIVVRISMRHRRSVGRFFKMLSSVARSGPLPNATSPEAHASGRQELARFDRAFRRLSPRKRAVFTLVNLEGMSTEQAAQALGIPAATVRTRLHHARRELAQAMNRRRDV